jgi:hypothetical protein
MLASMVYDHPPDGKDIPESEHPSAGHADSSSAATWTRETPMMGRPLLLGLRWVARQTGTRRSVDLPA